MMIYLYKILKLVIPNEILENSDPMYLKALTAK